MNIAKFSIKTYDFANDTKEHYDIDFKFMSVIAEALESIEKEKDVQLIFDSIFFNDPSEPVFTDEMINKIISSFGIDKSKTKEFIITKIKEFDPSIEKNPQLIELIEKYIINKRYKLENVKSILKKINIEYNPK